MASAFALAIFSGIGFLFGIQKSLRAFLNPLFTSRVVTENGICSAAFCESAALWAASSPSQALTRQLSQRESLWRDGKARAGREKLFLSGTIVPCDRDLQQLDKERLSRSCRPL